MFVIKENLALKLFFGWFLGNPKSLAINLCKRCWCKTSRLISGFSRRPMQLIKVKILHAVRLANLLR